MSASGFDTTELTAAETVEAILAATSPSRFPVVVSDYDHDWPALFDEIAGRDRPVLADLSAELEQVGSTAVPGLAAKPVIDVDVVLRSAGAVPTAIGRLRTLRYAYQGDKGIEGREAFMWPPGAKPDHLYAVAAGSKPHADHVQFRDYFRQHPAAADEYAALKWSLAERHGNDRAAYTDAKSAFITRSCGREALTAVMHDGSARPGGARADARLA